MRRPWNDDYRTLPERFLTIPAGDADPEPRGSATAGVGYAALGFGILIGFMVVNHKAKTLG